MSQPTIRPDVFESGDVLLYLPAQRSFNGVILVENRREAADFVVREVLGAPIRIDLGLLTEPKCGGRTDAVNITEGDVSRFVVGDVNAQDTGHVRCPRLPLSLLVPRVRADDEEFSVPAYQFAVLADTLYAGPHLHRGLRRLTLVPMK